MHTARRFIFRDFELDRTRSEIIFRYEIEYSDAPSEIFIDTLVVPDVLPLEWSSLPAPLLFNLLQALHIVLGIPYWKMYCPPTISIANGSLTSEQAHFWNIVYQNGLGEFFYRNNIDFTGLINFPYSPQALANPTPIDVPPRSLVPFGGGKDSAVTVELLQSSRMPLDLFSFGTSYIQEYMTARVGLSLHSMTHRVDPRLIARSNNRTVLRGHIPYTAMYTFASLLYATIKGYRWIVFSNEQSANFGNIEYRGLTINHQWSKSYEFEKLCRAYIAQFVTPNVVAFSLLRPLHEIEIVRRFTQIPRYLDAFSSCNGNFVGDARRTNTSGGPYWCGTCAKCAFVFTCLAAFLPKETVVGVVGKNMFEDAQLVPLFAALLGIDSFKPFECVGTPDEMILAMHLADVSGTYMDEPVMKLYRDTILPRDIDFESLKRNLLAVGDTSDMMAPFDDLLSRQT